MKYVCDFDRATEISNSLNSIADEMMSAISSYESDINSALSSWNGVAKNSFNSANAQQVANIKNGISLLNETADFINKAVQAIQDAESSLASLSI